MSFYSEHKSEIISFMQNEGFRLNLNEIERVTENQTITYHPSQDEQIKRLVEIPFEEDSRIVIYTMFAQRCIKSNGKCAKESEIFEDVGLCYETARTAIFGKVKRNPDGKRFITQTNPSKEIVLRLGIALRLNEDELARFVHLFNKPFPRDNRDALIRYFIQCEEYKTKLSWKYKYYCKGMIWLQLRSFLNDARESGWKFAPLEISYDRAH